jgi:hypothetical protein
MSVAERIEGGIGDDVCAVMLKLDVTVVDSSNQPVPDAELWEIDRRHVTGKALRLGATDPSGHLEALDCYMASLEFRFWHPAEEPVRLNFMVLREGFGTKHLTLAPSTQGVLDAGNLLGVPPGESFDWSQVKSGPLRAFGITATVRLPRAEPDAR